MIRFSMLQLTIPILTLALLIYITIIAARQKQKKFKKSNVFVDTLFICYCSVLFGLLYTPLTINLGAEARAPIYFNAVPIWYTIKSFSIINSGLRIYTIFIIFANICAFMPLSAYMAIRFRGNQKRKLITIIIVSGMAEILQLILIILTGFQDHSIDIDDLIFNCGGAIIFYLIFNRLLEAKGNPDSIQTT